MADPPAAEDPPRRRGRQAMAVAEQTRLAIADAALRVFAAQGFAGASVRDIAASAGVAHGLLRHHFGSKDGLWRAAVDYSVGLWADALKAFTEGPAERQGDPIAEAKAAIRATLGVFRRHPEFVRLVMHEGVSGGPRLDYALERMRGFEPLMRPVFRRVQEQGRWRHLENRHVLLFILTAGAAPLTVPALAGQLIGGGALSDTETDAHVERFLSTLLGEG